MKQTNFAGIEMPEEIQPTEDDQLWETMEWCLEEMVDYFQRHKSMTADDMERVMFTISEILNVTKILRRRSVKK